MIRSLLEFYTGEATDRFLRTPYWRTGTEPPDEGPIDPREDDCGLYWVSPVVPLREEDVNRFLDVARTVYDASHLEFCVTVNVVSARAAAAVAPILFDRANDEETAAATDLYRRLRERLVAEGYVPYRESVLSMETLEGDPDYWGLCRRLKAAIDPEGIIAPGRYEPASDDGGS